MDIKFPRPELYPPDLIEQGVYSAVVIDFLDRSTGKLTRQLCYPVTRLALVNDPENLDKARVFTVANAFGQWKEIPERPPAQPGEDS